MINAPLDVPDDATAAMIRSLKPWQRLAAVCDMNHTARLRLAGFFRTRHPDWSDEQIAAAVAERMSRGTS